jgi:hypothetical protein
MSQGCAMVLLLAMMLAMAAGMMVGGPIVIMPHDPMAASRDGIGIPRAVRVLACLPLAAAGAWGWRAAWRCGWPRALRTPWLAFFGSCMALAVVAVAYHLDASDAGRALIHVLTAAAMATLTLAFMAERVDALFGRTEAVVGACAVAGCAGLWWFAGHWVGGPADLRALLFLECLPLLLIPAGALSLPGEHTRAVDWLGILGLYVLARGAGLVHGLAALMVLLLAAMAGCAAYRLVSVSPGRPVRDAAASDPTQRSTSLNTSS